MTEAIVAGLYFFAGGSAILLLQDVRTRTTVIALALIAWIWIVFFLVRAAFHPCCGQTFLNATTSDWSKMLHIPNAGFLIYLVNRMREYR